MSSKLGRMVCPVCSGELRRYRDGHRARTCGSPECVFQTKSTAGKKQTHAPGRFAREKHPRWNGGRSIDRWGYVQIWVGKQKYEREHRLVMEKELGRELSRHEYVHHLNGIKTDNRTENLCVVSPRQHNTRNFIVCLQDRIKELEKKIEDINQG